MSRGYPINFAAAKSARGSAAVATAVARQPLSLGALARGAVSMPKIPPPHPALLIGVAAAVAIGYGYRYLNEQGEEEEGKAPLAAPVRSLPGGTQINAQLTHVETRYSPYFNDNPVVVFDGGSGGAYCGSLISNGIPGPYGRWRPDKVFDGTAPSTYYTDPDGAADGVPAGWNAGFYTKVTFDPNYFGQQGARLEIYVNPESVTVEPATEDPPKVSVMPLAPAELPRSVSDGSGTDLDREAFPAIPDIPQVSPRTNERGVATAAEVGVINPMVPGLEVKAHASHATMRVIQMTAGQLGEAFDMTRCFMYATGNTYTTRSGAEKVIPKWQWSAALAEIAGQQPYGNKLRKHRRYTKYRDGAFVAADGKRVLSSQEVGTRLASCLLWEQAQDIAIAKGSQKLQGAANKFGLHAGPLGVQSIYQALQGEMMYEGLFDLNLEN